MLKIFKFSFFDLIRSRWSIAYFIFYLLTAFLLLYLSSTLAQAVISLSNVIITLSPLIGTLFGIMYYYNSRDFIELLLAQPLNRRSIFVGQYLGLSISISLSLLLGVGIPFVIYGIFVSAEIWNFYFMLITGVLLTFIFIALASLIAIYTENKIRGFGLAIMMWLFMAVLYDGFFLLSLFYFEHYPLEKFSIAISLLNPIDLSRIIIMLKLDFSALMGYTGAVFNKFFGTNWGIIISISMSLLWIILPLSLMVRKSATKDF